MNCIDNTFHTERGRYKFKLKCTRKIGMANRITSRLIA